MKLKINTKWGSMDIDPEKIDEMTLKLNPWNNVYKLTIYFNNPAFVAEGDFKNMEDLNYALLRITQELDFIKQYKFRDESGALQINENKRLRLTKERREQKRKAEGEEAQ
jgi:hypothetical protein